MFSYYTGTLMSFAMQNSRNPLEGAFQNWIFFPFKWMNVAWSQRYELL